MHVDGKRSLLLHRRKAIATPDVVIPRIAPSTALYGLAVVNHFALSGATLLNDAEAIARSRNRMGALQLLSSSGIGVPRTVMGRDAKSIRESVSLVGGLPVLVKLLQGERQGVMLCESSHSLEAALEALLGLGQNLVVQQYVRRSGERDLRVLVIGGRVLCAVRRIPKAGRLSTTLGKGARLEAVELRPSVAEQAVKATRLMGLDLAAVDLLVRGSEAKVFEVDATPALAALERATGLDLAGAIVEHAVAKVHAHARARVRMGSGR